MVARNSRAARSSASASWAMHIYIPSMWHQCYNDPACGRILTKACAMSVVRKRHGFQPTRRACIVSLFSQRASFARHTFSQSSSVLCACWWPSGVSWSELLEHRQKLCRRRRKSCCWQLCLSVDAPRRVSREPCCSSGGLLLRPNVGEAKLGSVVVHVDDPCLKIGLPVRLPAWRRGS